MNLRLQKRLAADVLKCSSKRIMFNEDHLSEISEAITKNDVRDLVKQGLIVKLQKIGVSRGRARFKHIQKKKGRRTGHGSRKGKHSARIGGSKLAWILKVRSQRKLIFSLRNDGIVKSDIFMRLYRMVKGGFFRSRRHILIYLRDSSAIAPEKFDELVLQIKNKNKKAIAYMKSRMKKHNVEQKKKEKKAVVKSAKKKAAKVKVEEPVNKAEKNVATEKTEDKE